MHVVLRLVLLEAHVHQLIDQRLRSLPYARLGRVGVRPVQFRGLPAPGKGHAQHAAEQLLHVLRAVQACDRTEHVRERAVPALLERLDRDDVLDRAVRVEQVDAVQFALVAGRHRDAVFGHLLHVDQVPFQRLDRYLLVLLLRLEQDDGADAAGLLLRHRGECGALGDRAVHRVLPRVVLGQDDRQLDHLLALQFLRTHAVQNVGLGPWRGRELHDGAWIYARLHLARQTGHRVVRLVHDHQRPVQMQQIGEREFDAPAGQLLQPGPRRRHRGKVRLQVLVVGVHLAALGVGYAQGLDGADHEAAVVA